MTFTQLLGDFWSTFWSFFEALGPKLGHGAKRPTLGWLVGNIVATKSACSKQSGRCDVCRVCLECCIWKYRDELPAWLTVVHDDKYFNLINHQHNGANDDDSRSAAMGLFFAWRSDQNQQRELGLQISVLEYSRRAMVRRVLSSRNKDIAESGQSVGLCHTPCRRDPVLCVADK